MRVGGDTPCRPATFCLEDMHRTPSHFPTGKEPSVDESAIRRAWDKGDMGAAADAIVAQLGREVLSYLVGILVDSDVADDAFSSWCARVWSSLPKFEWRSSVRTWVYVLARRASVDIQRAEGRRGRRRVPLSRARVSAIADQVRTTTLPLLRTEGRNALARLRDELPEDDRTLLVLRVDRELEWADLARILSPIDSPTDDVIRRESARLRKRFQLVKARLRERARAAGLLTDHRER
jgi:RNA polymerase sigma-70 factor (ECF subfamily)